MRALFLMNDQGQEKSAKTKRDLVAMWDGVDSHFLDIISMLGCDMLHNVSLAMTEAKWNTAAFVGVNVILAGYFPQLPPVGYLGRLLWAVPRDRCGFGREHATNPD